MGNRKNKDKAYEIFQAAGIFLILLGILALMNDTFLIIPYYVKAILLFISAYIVIFISNILKGED